MHSHSNIEETPLHTTARFGVPELTALYLCHGASVNAVNSFQETPLMTAVFWAYDSKEQTYSQNHHLVCRLLLDQEAGESAGPAPSHGLTFVFFGAFQSKIRPGFFFAFWSRSKSPGGGP